MAVLTRVVGDAGSIKRKDGQTFTALGRCWQLCSMLLGTFDSVRLVWIGRTNSFLACLCAISTITRLKILESGTAKC